jgi:hypothetical protein
MNEVAKSLREQVRDLKRRICALENASVTSRICALEQFPSQGGFDRFLWWCIQAEVDLKPWRKRIAALRKQILLSEVHES